MSPPPPEPAAAPGSSSARERALAALVALAVLGPFVAAVVRPFEAWPWTSAPMYAHRIDDDSALWRFRLVLEFDARASGGRLRERALDWKKQLRTLPHHAWRGFFTDVYGAADPKSPHAFPSDDAARFEARSSAWFALLVQELRAREAARTEDLSGVRLEIERVARAPAAQADDDDAAATPVVERRVVGRFGVAGGRYARAQEWP